MSGVRVVCFDWGGVILRICRSWDEGCRRAGIPLPPPGHAADRQPQRRTLSEQYHRGEISCDAFFTALSATTGGSISPAEVRLIHDAWLVDEYPGVGALVDTLHTIDGITTAMLSNTNHAHWARQHDGPDGFPTAARLHIRLASHELGLAKPDPAIYHAATESFGVEPGQVLFFDDMPENIDAARAIGWQARQIDHTGDTCKQMREHLTRAGVLQP